MTTNADDLLLKRVFKDEENDNIVLSIREEIMDRVMDECYKSYLKKQTIRFLVQCTYDAMQSIWTADDPIETSPKDTWACDAVPIRPADYKAEEPYFIPCGSESIQIGSSHKILGSVNTVSTVKEQSSEEIPCCVCLEHVCTCVVPPEEISKRFDLMYRKPLPSKVKFTRKSSKSGSTSTEKMSTASTLDQSYSEVSEKTATTTTDLSSMEKIVCKQPLKNKKKEKTSIKEAKLSIPEKLERGSTASVVGLPPIRVNSLFNSKPAEKPKKGG